MLIFAISIIGGFIAWLQAHDKQQREQYIAMCAASRLKEKVIILEKRNAIIEQQKKILSNRPDKQQFINGLRNGEWP